MKNNIDLEDLHIGCIIKEIVHQRGIFAKELAIVINRYRNNSDKIFLLKDMYTDDIVQISYLLKYNILDFLSKKYLPYLPFPDCAINFKSHSIKVNMKDKQVMVFDISNNCDFLTKIHIGQYIKKVAKKKEWDEKNMAKQLKCSQSAVSNLYKKKSLKVKTLIQISATLQYHFIAEAYLAQMIAFPFLNMIANRIIILTAQNIYFENSDNATS
jgi:DNA-binding Xre family transcriptional regulator